MLFIKLFFNVQFYYLKTLFIKQNRQSDLAFASEYLLNENSSIYRLSAIEKNKPHISLKVTLRILKRLFGKQIIQYQNKNGELVLIDEVNTNESEKRISFIEKVTNQKVHTFLSKEELVQYNLNLCFKVLVLFIIGINLFWLFPICLFSKKRMHYAQYLYFITESFLSIYFILKSGSTKVVMSCIYSQDSNINYILFKKFNIDVIKNPSEDALAFDNQILLADGLIICNPYQIEEVKILQYVKIKYLINGLGEQALEYENKYRNFIVSDNNVIGYYSSGSWLRKQQSMNYTHQGIDCAEQEEDLLIKLKNFLNENTNFKLRIFLHPVEKRNGETIEKVKCYLQSILGSLSYDFADFITPTCLNFEACNVAISLFSGSSLYRLNFGYKSLYYSPINSFKDFPFKNTTLQNINIGNTDFNLFLLEVLNFSEPQFFKIYNLENYLYSKQLNKIGTLEAA